MIIKMKNCLINLTKFRGNKSIGAELVNGMIKSIPNSGSFEGQTDQQKY
jgi:hypothetical protein